MQVKLSNIRQIVLSGLIAVGVIFSAQAADISAIDFNGNLLGKVIPDGTVVNVNNELVGHITADGFAVDEANNLIGGVVPQGVAISNNNGIIGKVNNDGSVTSLNDALVGKVLPNGLVVNDNYDILGAIISPGLVYNDSGKIVGRVSGDGKFYNLSGENNGIVTPSGYVYGRLLSTGQKMDIIGRLISAKIVVALDGKFLGSLAPDGKVFDLEKKIVGNIHANGFVYNADGQAVGHIVEEGYAFKLDGTYLGVVSYNGNIIDKGNTVATAVFGNKAIDKEGNVIGFIVSMSAVANTLDGKYYGRIVPEGNIVKGRDVIGRVGTSGNIIGSNGNVIALLSKTGPVFDSLGTLRANATINGTVVSLDGVDLGYTQKNAAYDRRGREIGRVLDNQVIYANNNEFMGISGINSLLLANKKTYIVSPYGYVFDENGQLSGHSFSFAEIIANDGKSIGYIVGDGKTNKKSVNEVAKMTASGTLLDINNKLLGGVYQAEYVTDFSGNIIGYNNPTNLVVNKQNKLIARILPDGDIVDLTGKRTEGYAGSSILSIGINGDYLGISDVRGNIKNNGEIIGRVSSDSYIVDNMGALYGAVLPFAAVVSSDCRFLGVVSESGVARTAKDTFLGTVLTNGQVINETEDLIGYVISPSLIVGENGISIGMQTPLGSVLNYNNQNIGCQDIYGKIVNSQKETIGRKVEKTTVMDFNNKVIGIMDFNGNIVNSDGEKVAYLSIDGGIQNFEKSDIGVLFKYRVAFDDSNIYLGRINSQGKVIADSGNVIGTVDYNGAVLTNDGKSGYALYDLYVYDNNGKTIGYIAKNGHVYSVMGELKGTIYQGFVLDKKQNLIARGSRDFYIRNKNKKIIGVLNLDGQVIDNKNIIVGHLGENGEILDADGLQIAQAEPLQYYHQLKNNITKEDSSEIVSSKENKEISEPTEPFVNENIENDEDNIISLPDRQVVGIAITPGGRYIGDVYDDNQVIDSNGNIIGKQNENGEILDESGNIIGSTQEKKTESKKSINPNWWRDITKGATASPYSTNNEAVNVGPGGGIGPHERYNPRRAEIIAELQKSRRQSLSGKSIQSGYDGISYTGWQDSWDGVDHSISTLRVDMSYLITADKPIPAVLSRSYISIGGAPVTAIVERNVYADSGRNVIIPAGSRIIGGLNGSTNGERSRFDNMSGGVKLDITWQRIIRPDGIVFHIDSSQTGDAQGRGGGALGYVDEQLLKKYGMPIAGTLATSAMAYVMAANEDATGEVETSKQQAASDARQQFIEKMDEIIQEIIDSKSRIEPVTYVPVGTRIIIYPMVDLWLRNTKNIEKGERTSGGKAKNVLIDETAMVNAPNQNTNTPVVSGGNVQNNNRQNTGAVPLVSDTPNNQQNQNRNTGGGSTGALPPPAADGTVANEPQYEDDDSGDIELF